MCRKIFYKDMNPCRRHGVRIYVLSSIPGVYFLLFTRFLSWNSI